MRLLLVLCLAGVLSLQAQPVTKKIDLLEVIKSGNVEHHVNPKMDFHDDPKDIWTFAADGTFNISGRGYGYVATKENYRDYHLVIEFKWGTKTWGVREKKAKDNGILLHAYGPHGAYADTWMASIEAQIIEGGVGDILVLSPKLADGAELTTSVSAEFALDRDKEKIWKQGEPRQTVTKGRINWKGRDEDWADRLGFRGKNDVESPPGEWNRLEVIAKGDTLQYFVNGALVNEAFDCKPSEGKILLQTEGAEMIVRRYELYPPGGFTEKWSAIQASGGSDVSVRDGQDKALSPEESLKHIQLDGPYEVQLVAAEPLVLDPVECTWNEKGRMFVADMRDYPLGPPKAGDPWLSRIQLLTDDDGNGRMDKAVTFADHLDNVQGLLPYNGGLIATTRTQILFLKDTNGDNVADEIKPLIKGFNPRHSQLQVSAPSWGLDGCVHFNNGLDAKEIYPADAPDKVVGVPGSNFKWDPRTGVITPTGGKGQYGGAFDDWGHHFYCSNRNPVMFTVMPYEAMLRNPHAGITQNYEDIAPAGAETRVYPLKITHTTADAHAGTNTACSGLGVYRGQLMPELKNNVFVPDPTGQLITRYKIEPNGASLKATRVGDRTEFFRSADEWCRPVNFTTGPDGAIYICDIYRRWIDHARFFPEEFVKSHDMRQGENEGRIWRVVPKGKNAKKVEPAPKKIEDLVAWLGHENAWQRETAQRLLVDASNDHDRVVRLTQLKALCQQVGKSEQSLAHIIWTHYGLVSSFDGPVEKGATSSPWLIDILSGNYRMAAEVFAEFWSSHADFWFRYDQKTEAKVRAFLGHRTFDTRESLLQLCAGKINFSISQYLQAARFGKQDPWLEKGIIISCSSQPGLLLAEYLNANSTGFPLIHLSQGGGVSYRHLSCDLSNKEVLREIARLARSDWEKASKTDAAGKNGYVWIYTHPQTSFQKLITVMDALEGAGASKYLFATQEQETKSESLVKGLMVSCLANGDRDDISEALLTLGIRKGDMLAWKPALLQGLAEGLPRSGGKLGVKTLAEFIAKPPQGFEGSAKESSVLLTKVDDVIADPKSPLDQCLAVLPLLASRKWDAVQPLVKSLLTSNQPAELTTATLALMKKFSITSTAPLIYELLPKAGPALKRDLVPMLTGNATTALELFKRMEKGEFPTAWVDVETRWRYQRGTGEMADLAKKLFGEASSDRAAVVSSYLEAAKHPGDAAKGQQVFASICITCHKHGTLGVDVGPPLSDVKVKPPEALLADILDPNRMFEARWSAYQIDTHDNRILSGIVESETPDAIVLAMMGGAKETLPRSAIKEMKSLDRSLMPPGLEAGITKEQMSDLLAFLLGR